MKSWLPHYIAIGQTEIYLWAGAKDEFNPTFYPWQYAGSIKDESINPGTIEIIAQCDSGLKYRWTVDIFHHNTHMIEVQRCRVIMELLGDKAELFLALLRDRYIPYFQREADTCKLVVFAGR